MKNRSEIVTGNGELQCPECPKMLSDIQVADMTEKQRNSFFDGGVWDQKKLQDARHDTSLRYERRCCYCGYENTVTENDLRREKK